MLSGVVEPKRGVNVGRVVVQVTVENYGDVERADLHEIPTNSIRKIEVSALVDSGATFFCLPKSLIEQLGLKFQRTKEARTVAGPMSLGIYGAAKLSVEGRECITEVMELPEGRQSLMGQIPLEMMDFWIDLTNQCLVGNPEHGGQWMAEVF